MDKDNQFIIERENNKYEVVIGLEVHAQVTSQSKLFSSSSTKFGSEPNTQVSLVDAAFPVKAASTKLTCVLGSDPNFVDEEENNLD